MVNLYLIKWIWGFNQAWFIVWDQIIIEIMLTVLNWATSSLRPQLTAAVLETEGSPKYLHHFPVWGEGQTGRQTERIHVCVGMWLRECKIKIKLRKGDYMCQGKCVIKGRKWVNGDPNMLSSSCVYSTDVCETRRQGGRVCWLFQAALEGRLIEHTRTWHTKSIKKQTLAHYWRKERTFFLFSSL